MVKQFLITLKGGLGAASVQHFVDLVRSMSSVASAEPIIEMGSPMSEDDITIQKARVLMYRGSGDPKLVALAKDIQALITEVERARRAELVSQGVFKRAAEAEKSYELELSTLRQRLAQLGEGDRR